MNAGSNKKRHIRAIRNLQIETLEKRNVYAAINLAFDMTISEVKAPQYMPWPVNWKLDYFIGSPQSSPIGVKAPVIAEITNGSATTQFSGTTVHQEPGNAIITEVHDAGKNFKIWSVFGASGFPKDENGYPMRFQASVKAGDVFFYQKVPDSNPDNSEGTKYIEVGRGQLSIPEPTIRLLDPGFGKTETGVDLVIPYVANGKSSPKVVVSGYWQEDNVWVWRVNSDDEPAFRQEVQLLWGSSSAPRYLRIDSSSLTERPANASYLWVVIDDARPELFGFGRVVEQDEQDNVRVMQFVDDFAWLVHGWNPLSAVVGWESFRHDYGPQGIFHETTEEALEGDGDLASVNMHAWESSVGFTDAIAFQVIKMASIFSPGFFSIAGRWLDRLINLSLITSNVSSRSASASLAKDILAKVEYALIKHDSSERMPSVTLIGHSRGGEVAARALRNIRGTLGNMNVDSQLILLDAFGTDWPGLASIIGVDVPVGEENDYNFRANEGLVKNMDSLIGQLIQSTINTLGVVTIPINQIPNYNFTDFFGIWRAPARPSMKNREIIGSTHLNLPELFFVTGMAQYLDAAHNRASGEGSSAIEIPLVVPVRGGSASELLESVSSLRSQLSGVALANSWEEILAKLATSERSWLKSAWATVGQVELDEVSSRFLLNGNASSMSQLVAMPLGRTKLVLRGLIDLGNTSGAELAVYIGNKLVQSVPVSSTSEDVTIDIVLGQEENRFVDLRLELRTNQPSASIGFSEVELAIRESRVTGAFAVIDGAAGFNLKSDGSNDVGEYRYFVEANGIEGLQLGTDGDFEVAVDGNGVGYFPQEAIARDALMVMVPQPDDGRYFEYLFLENRSTTNTSLPEDVNDDGIVSPLDALLVINSINRGVTYAIRESYLMDVNIDGVISPIDALLVINYINTSIHGEGESDYSVDVEETSSAADSVEQFVDLELLAEDMLISKLRRSRYMAMR